MPDRKFSFDIECFWLAEHFIKDKPLGTDEHLNELAQTIQDAIGDWIVTKEEELDQ